MEDKKETIKIIPMPITTYPLRENVVGEAGQFVDEFIQATDSEMIYNVMGVQPDKSFLITGAPGNGKTFAIEALVNQINNEPFLKFMKDPTSKTPPEFKMLAFKYDTGKYGTAYINRGSKIVQSVFDTCFMVAKRGYKSMMIFDEAETLFGNRSDRVGHKEDTKVLETIMKNMQTLHDTPNAYAVMMSNFPEAFDAASIRSGRVDKRYEFGNPTQTEREFAYTHSINQINEKAGYKVVRGCDPSKLAKMSDNFSYSDITESVNSAVKQKARDVSMRPQDGMLDLNIWITEKGVRKSIADHREQFKTTKSRKRIGFL